MNPQIKHVKSEYAYELKEAGYHTALGSKYFFVLRKQNSLVLLIRCDDDSYDAMTINKRMFKDLLRDERIKLWVSP